MVGMQRLQWTRGIWQRLSRDTYDYITIPQATEGSITCHLPIQSHHLNRLGTVHGGVLAMLVDVGGSLALSTYGYGVHSLGVTTDLSVSMLNSAHKGDILCMVGACDKLGRNMAFTAVDLRILTPTGELGQWVAKGRHTKYVKHMYKETPHELVD